MACEIVITSVPRGVKLGRTGFQVAMQTAGMRDDVAAAIERMAGYRHLPPGSGPNPVSYFHRIATTVAGRMNVIGRIRDAGVDFSNRSNKLAHMVILDSADLGAVAASSPAAVLAAIEGRLASTWTGGPEERQIPFSLAGIPSSNPAICTLWQQMAGDAGWAGVMAERALRNEPTLLIGTDSTDESCRRMLMLFQQALALIPPNKRWGVTFDTTTLTPDVLWRGTYAGSPESLVSQAGVHVIDLRHPQKIPATMAVGELVETARTGSRTPPLPVPLTSAPTVAIPGSPSNPLPVGGQGESVEFCPPPPPPNASTRTRERIRATEKERPPSTPWLRIGIMLGVGGLCLLIPVGVFLFNPFQDPHKGDQTDRKQPLAVPALVENHAEQDPTARDNGVEDADRIAAEEKKKEADRIAAEEKKKEADRIAAEEKKKEADRIAAEEKKAAFETFQRLLADAKNARASYWPLDDGKVIIKPSDELEKLDAEVVVGTTEGFAPKATRDGDSPKWNIMLDGKCLAIVDLTGGGLSVGRGDSKGEKMYDEESPLPFMTIAFKPRGEKNVGENDWITLLQEPGEIKLTNDQPGTLYELFVRANDEASVRIPSTLPKVHKAEPQRNWKKREFAVPGLPFKCAVIPSQAAWALAISADVQYAEKREAIKNDIKKEALTLNESLTMDFDKGDCRRVGDSWPERVTRFNKIGDKPKSYLIGVEDYQTIRRLAPFLGKSEVEVVPKLVAATLETGSGHSNQKTQEETAKDALRQWAPGIDPTPFERKQTLLKWRDTARGFLASTVDGDFAKFCEPQFNEGEGKEKDLLVNGKRPDKAEDPGPEPTGPGANAGQKEKEEFEKRKQGWKPLKDKFNKWLKWEDAAKKHYLKEACRPETLRAFIETDKGKKYSPEGIAARFLHEFDGLVLCGFYGPKKPEDKDDQLSQFLNRVPIAALFEGTIQLNWFVDGLGDVPVTVSKIEAAPILEAVPNTTAIPHGK